MYYNLDRELSTEYIDLEIRIEFDEKSRKSRGSPRKHSVVRAKLPLTSMEPPPPPDFPRISYRDYLQSSSVENRERAGSNHAGDKGRSTNVFPL